MDEALGEYIAECNEILERVSRILSEIEKGAPVQNHIDALYRDFHTLKGSSQLFGYTLVGQIAHTVEASLGPIRRLKVGMGNLLVDKIFRAIDLIERMVECIASEKKTDLKNFQNELNLVLPALVEAATAEFGRDFNTIFDGIPAEDLVVLSEESRSLKEPAPPVSASLEHTPRPKLVLKSELAQNREIKSSKAINSESAIPVGQNEIQKPAEMPKKEILNPMENKVEIKQESAATAETTIRVQVDVLDRLMNLAGELVLVRNQVIQHRDRTDDVDFLNLSKGLDLVTSDLQAEVMKTRMQPIGNVVSKFQRVVRDLGKDLGKQIDLTIQGAETELDKTLLEAVKDPLTHIIRNSCDHGIETVGERKAAGKPPNGHVLIRAFHEGGQILIEISDDGKGLDREKLIKKAIEKGLMTKEVAAKMSERDAYNIIFLPGFSTAQTVTSVSGRGVGMDVVKTNIEKIGGSVELASRLGKGTSIKIKIPLTLAIVPALTIRTSGERYAIPQVKLVELVRVAEDSAVKIEYVQGKPMYRLRGSILPLVYLNEVLSCSIDKVKSALETNSSVTNIVVLNAEGEKFGLVVDEVLDTTDIVVKSLSPFLKRESTFTGATIMGDGAISLILDVVGIAEMAHLSVRQNKRTEGFEDIRDAKKAKNSLDSQEFLLIKTTAKGVHVIPLCLVHRLEEFPVSKIEKSGNQMVVQYRNSILPLIDLDDALGYAKIPKVAGEAEHSLPTIVVQRSGKLYGLVVKEILDIILLETQIDDSIRDRPGIMGNLIYGDQILIVVDALGILENLQDGMGAATATSSPSSKSARNAVAEIQKRTKEVMKTRPKILYAEDVAFFRKQVTKVLNRAGYDVESYENGALALKRYEESAEEFVIILSDIEMPEMNGLEFARAIRQLQKGNDIPMIALTTRFKESDIIEGNKAGFSLYLEKLNEERLLNGILSVLTEKRVEIPVLHKEAVAK